MLWKSHNLMLTFCNMKWLQVLLTQGCDVKCDLNRDFQNPHARIHTNACARKDINAVRIAVKIERDWFSLNVGSLINTTVASPPPRMSFLCFCYSAPYWYIHITAALNKTSTQLRDITRWNRRWIHSSARAADKTHPHTGRVWTCSTYTHTHTQTHAPCSRWWGWRFSHTT